MPAVENPTHSVFQDDLSDAQKIKLMGDVLKVQGFNSSADSPAFPAFYALDLIQFGLKRDVPVAIRLGELILSNEQSGPAMPRELAQAVKDYMMENSGKYNAAARETGPINIANIYHQARQVSSRSGEQAPVFFNTDDPYWVEFAQKNYRREDNWRGPSVHAWNHRPKGILGEIIDVDRLDKAYEEYFRGDQNTSQQQNMKY